MTEQQSDLPLPESLKLLLDELSDMRREVRSDEPRYRVLSALLNPGGHSPAFAAMKSAYDRYCRGETEAMVELGVELKKAQDKDLFEQLQRMSIQEKRALLLVLGKTILVILDFQRSEQSRQQIPAEVMAALLEVDSLAGDVETPAQRSGRKK
jgi:hypothetical protein